MVQTGLGDSREALLHIEMLVVDFFAIQFQVIIFSSPKRSCVLENVQTQLIV
jgi:hypothetical protein